MCHTLEILASYGSFIDKQMMFNSIFCIFNNKTLIFKKLFFRLHRNIIHTLGWILWWKKRKFFENSAFLLPIQNADSNFENKKCYPPIYLTYLMENLWPIDTNDNIKGKDYMVSIWIRYTSFLDFECFLCQISFKEFSTTLHPCSW